MSEVPQRAVQAMLSLEHDHLQRFGCVPTVDVDGSKVGRWKFATDDWVCFTCGNVYATGKEIMEVRGDE